MTFSINGVAAVGVLCEWNNVAIRQNVQNVQVLSTFARHTWNVDVMLATLYNTFRTFRGLQVTLQSNDYVAFNTIDRVYPGAFFEAIGGNQEGHLMRNVNFVFRVDIT